MTYFVGVDVGGTKCAVTLIDAAGRTLERSWTEHVGEQMNGPTGIVLAAIAALLAARSLEPGDVTAYGIAVAGLVGRDRSTLVRAPTLGAVDLDLGARLAARLGRRVVVINDANAAHFGHVRLNTRTGDRAVGEGAGEEVSLLLALGTGIGGSIMVGGAIVVGESGYAAELGHVAVDFTDRRICLCGATGCVEQFASGRGVAELAALARPPADSQKRLLAMGAAKPYSARTIVGAAKIGDPWAVRLLAQGGAMLGRAIATLAVTLDPSVVIISGGFGHAAGAWLLPHAEAELRSRWPYADVRPLPPLRRDIIGPYAAATGAALLASLDAESEGHP